MTGACRGQDLEAQGQLLGHRVLVLWSEDNTWPAAQVMHLTLSRTGAEPRLSSPRPAQAPQHGQRRPCIPVPHTPCLCPPSGPHSHFLDSPVHSSPLPRWARPCATSCDPQSSGISCPDTSPPRVTRAPASGGRGALGGAVLGKGALGTAGRSTPVGTGAACPYR